MIGLPIIGATLIVLALSAKSMWWGSGLGLVSPSATTPSVKSFAGSCDVAPARVRLDGATWSSRHLERSDLTGVSLRGASLAGAQLQGAVLVKVDLRGANLAEANLTGADMRGACLEGADFSGATVSGVLVTGAIPLTTPITWSANPRPR